MEKQLNRILAKIDSMEAKLDRVIKALQEYDGLDEDFNEPEDEYAWKNVSPVVKNYDTLFDEAEANKRMDVIGQNGNTGEHYDMEKVKKATKKFGEKKVKEVREYLKDATFAPETTISPKPKRKYYKPKNKNHGNQKKSS